MAVLAPSPEPRPTPITGRKLSIHLSIHCALLHDVQRDVDDVRAVSNLTLAVVLASALAVAAWTYIVALHARDRGVPAVEPIRSAGLWLIPLFGGAAVMKRLARLVEAFVSRGTGSRSGDICSTPTSPSSC